MSLEQDILHQVTAASDEAALEAIRVATLGKKGSVSEQMKALGAMGPVIQIWRMVPVPAMSARVTVSPGPIIRAGAPLRPTPSGLAASPPEARAPVGFSNEIERVSSRLDRS